MTLFTPSTELLRGRAVTIYVNEREAWAEEEPEEACPSNCCTQPRPWRWRDSAGGVPRFRRGSAHAHWSLLPDTWLLVTSSRESGTHRTVVGPRVWLGFLGFRCRPGRSYPTQVSMLSVLHLASQQLQEFLKGK